MLALVLGYSYFFAPEPPEPNQEQTVEQTASDSSGTASNIEVPTPSSDVITQQTIDPVRDSIRKVMEAEQMNSKFGVFSAASSGSEQFFELENEHLKVAINSKGGWFHSAQLKDHFKYPQTAEVPVDLWNEELSSMQLWLNTASKGVLNTDELYFTIADQKAVDNGKQLTMRLNTSDPESHIDYIYTLDNGGYTVTVDMVFVGMDRHLNFTSGNRLEWKAAGISNEKGIEWERQHSSVFFREEGKDRDYLGEAKEDDDVIEDKLTWMSFKQNYFSALIINEEGFGKGASVRSYPPEDEEDVATTMFYEANLPLDLTPASTATSSLEFYFGPNDIVELNKLDVPEVSRIIDYGWWIFGWVNRNMIRPVFNWLSTFIGSAGVVILILTVLIKLLLFPITWKNYLSSAKMRVLKPEIDELNEKFKDKQVEKQQAQMALYKQTGVSPLAGCLPTLLQIPILYAMFRFFPAHISLRGESFLWADDLGAYDSILNLGFEIPLYGAHVSGFTLLMATSTFFYTRMNSANMPTNQQPGMPNMKLIMSLFPFMMLFFFNRYAAGLSLYYFVANLISIVQMLLIKKYFVDEEKIRAKIDAKKKGPKKESKFQAKLQDMYKLQQQQKEKEKGGKK